MENQDKNIPESASIGTGAIISGVDASLLLRLSKYSEPSNYSRTYVRACVTVWCCSGITRKELADTIGIRYRNAWEVLEQMKMNGHVWQGKRKDRRDSDTYHRCEGLRVFLNSFSGDDGLLSRVRALKCARRTDVDALLGMLGKQTGGE